MKVGKEILNKLLEQNKGKLEPYLDVFRNPELPVMGVVIILGERIYKEVVGDEDKPVEKRGK